MRPALLALLLACLAIPASGDAPVGSGGAGAASVPQPPPAFFWSGTAPACEAAPSDCTANFFFSWGESVSGIGAACASGYKYLCASAPRSDWHVTVVGTAPACNASCSDCPQGYACWTWTNSGISSAGGGSTCWSGIKVICIKPKVE